MTPSKPLTIDDVINQLEDIILQSKAEHDPAGYFAVLYQRVTKKVKEGIRDDFFEDGARMERLTVIFANRYLDAYHAYKKGEPVTQSWQRTLDMTDKYWPTVLQHLLMGINTHINLDLGIVAAEVMQKKDVEELRNDFFKINEVLEALVGDVQNNLSAIWPTLRLILKYLGKFDDWLIGFSMGKAREGAWKFAKELSHKTDNELSECIQKRDARITKIGDIIARPGLHIQLTLGLIRLFELGSVKQKIIRLKAVQKDIAKEVELNR